MTGSAGFTGSRAVEKTLPIDPSSIQLQSHPLCFRLYPVDPAKSCYPVKEMSVACN
jgi:hypothetical protein